MRLQLALNVDDIDQAVEFYSKLFDTTPAKRKPGYANFAIANPPLKLVLFEVKDAAERINHLGVEVFDGESVTAATERLKAAGLETLVEDETTCCYAKQDKVWAVEPQGLRWEWYRVLEDSETFAGRPTPPATMPTPAVGAGDASATGAASACAGSGESALEGCCG